MKKHYEENRKEYPVFKGLLEYFPRACLYVSHVSFKANKQHNGDSKMHWDKEKSIGEGDEIVRHLIDGKIFETYDDDGIRHLGKTAWRALELLERELEEEENI